MKFLMMIKSSEDRKVLPKELAEAIGRLSADPSAAVVLASGALAGSAAGARVRISDGQLTLTDGPFSETKEVVGGFGIVEYASKEEAWKGAREFMELYRKYWPGWEGEMEIRQILTQEEYARLENR